MTQNRKKLIDLFIGNLSNSILHKIMEKSIDNEDVATKYEKELTTSFEIAKKYRAKINPINSTFPDKDMDYIKTKIRNKVRAELLVRISRGYKNIDLGLVEKLVDEFLEDMNVI
ncbi:MAG: hypothetical protein ISS82_02735 [Nanoarchaeota archaeon]|nr:hypothetical protein [Nanoarchaeota archaeon]